MTRRAVSCSGEHQVSMGPRGSRLSLSMPPGWAAHHLPRTSTGIALRFREPFVLGAKTHLLAPTSQTPHSSVGSKHFSVLQPPLNRANTWPHIWFKNPNAVPGGEAKGRLSFGLPAAGDSGLQVDRCFSNSLENSCILSFLFKLLIHYKISKNAAVQALPGPMHIF